MGTKKRKERQDQGQAPFSRDTQIPGRMGKPFIRLAQLNQLAVVILKSTVVISNICHGPGRERKCQVFARPGCGLGPSKLRGPQLSQVRGCLLSRGRTTVLGPV